MPARAAARVLQYLAWMLLTSLVGAALAAVIDAEDGPSVWAAVAFLTIGPYVGEVLLVGRLGWDPGKIIVGLRTIDARTGRPPGVPRAALRSVVLHAPYLLSLALIWAPSSTAAVLSWLYLPWLVLVLWSIGRNPEGTGWHDEVAGTVVVRDPRRVPQPEA